MKVGVNGPELLDVCLETFVVWLVDHEHEVVGIPRLCFGSPLARWLSEMTGYIYGVDDGRFGRALWDDCYWRPLPRWAQVFSAWSDMHPQEIVTGQDAFCVLAQVERVLSWTWCPMT